MRPSIVVVGFVFLLVPFNAEAQSPSRFCSSADTSIPGDVVLDISQNGRGMVWPNLITVTFFRLHDDGRFEYDARTRKGVIRKMRRLDLDKLKLVHRLVDSPDLVSANEKYSLLEDFKDAILRTCITVKRGNDRQRILIVNYMPEHAAAKGYYPDGLMGLTRMVSRIRPRTKYEREYGGGGLF